MWELIGALQGLLAVEGKPSGGTMPCIYEWTIFKSDMVPYNTTAFYFSFSQSVVTQPHSSPVLAVSVSLAFWDR